jgi:hypothetical protein
VLPSLGKLDVADLTAARLRKWLADLAAAPARKRTGAGRPQKHSIRNGHHPASER